MSAGGRPRLLVATGNAGKLREIEALLGDCGVDLVCLADFPAFELPEEGDDYAQNARAKALRAARACGLPAVADDSGIEVDGLGGRPGVHSARYGGAGLDDTGRVAKLLAELGDAPRAERGARFYCCAALARPDGPVITRDGECRGRILSAPRGVAGFGYDPIFWLDEHAATMAELPARLKNRISHRAHAFAALAPEIRALA